MKHKHHTPTYCVLSLIWWPGMVDLGGFAGCCCVSLGNKDTKNKLKEKKDTVVILVHWESVDFGLMGDLFVSGHEVTELDNARYEGQFWCVGSQLFNIL
ncbi:hypothetical protein BDV40DRAFT_276991 [Aspergillus tamarii]|uniref:Uncharacterized protein n=1 Tax=Aspergillus tamarii TaxID=41984 RepID=A0A5N6UHJ5_ASPTM|nr:hypothetical protein BDV40DRAFT_276991 [Aspergillus tamarii]